MCDHIKEEMCKPPYSNTLRVNSFGPFGLRSRCWIILHRHFKGNVCEMYVFFFFGSKLFAYLSFVLCLLSLSCLVKMKYQRLFHVMYEPYIHVRHRKFIIVAPMSCKCTIFTFLFTSLLYKLKSQKPYTLPVLPPTASNSIYHFCLLCPPEENCCIYII